MGRQSTIDRLPAETREALNAWLRDPAITQEQATERLNGLLDEIGQPELKVTRHAVNRYDMRMRQVGERLRQSRAVAEMWIAKLGAQPQGQLGHLVNEMLRTMAFELTLKLQEGELTEESMPAVIDQLKQLSLSVMRLERAASENVKREAEIREQARREAADAAEKVARQGGLSTESVQELRRAILGVRSP
jgi:hypothetical protein